MEPKDSYHYYCTGLTDFEKGEFECALENFLKSSELDPHFKTYERISHVLRKLNRFEEADYFMEEAYLLNPKNDKTATGYSELLLRRGETGPAKDILNEIICRNPSYGPARRLIAEIANKDNVIRRRRHARSHTYRKRRNILQYICQNES